MSGSLFQSSRELWAEETHRGRMERGRSESNQRSTERRSYDPNAGSLHNKTGYTFNISLLIKNYRCMS